MISTATPTRGTRDSFYGDRFIHAATGASPATLTPPCMCGGDFNIRDREVPSQHKSHDCWILAGKPKDQQFTWALSRNENVRLPNGAKAKYRFDRMYIIGAAPCVDPAGFELVGTKRLKKQDRFASEHFGVFTSFKVDR